MAVFCMSLCSCSGPVPVDVVMAGNEVFFVLEKPMEIRSLWVAPYDPAAAGKELKPAWALRHDLTTDVKARKYPKLKQLKYGQKFTEFPVVAGPEELKKNIEYIVGIEMGGKFAREIFILTEDNKVVMPRPAFARQKGRAYTVLADKDGNEKLLLVPAGK